MAYATAIALYAHQQGGVRGALTTFGGLVGLCSLALLRRFRGLDVELRPPAELAMDVDKPQQVELLRDDLRRAKGS